MSHFEDGAPAPKLLRSVGLRPTQPRIATLLAMERAGVEPLCIFEVCRRLGHLGVHASLSTVQRALVDLENRGLLRREVLEGRSHFRRMADMSVLRKTNELAYRFSRLPLAACFSALLLVLLAVRWLPWACQSSRMWGSVGRLIS